MLRPDFAPLVGVTSFNGDNGVEDNPLLRGWIEAAQQGELVTPAQRNAMVAQLAWAQSILARPPGDVPRLVATDGTVIPFPYGVSTDGALVLGADDYVDGDVVLPPAPRPAGAAAATPGGVAGASEYIANAQRREAFDNTTNALAALALRPGQIVRVEGAAPAGWVGHVLAIAVVGVAAYAAYSAYVDAEVARQAGATAQVRIREEAGTARVVAQTQAQTTALSMRLNHAARTGVLVPPSAIETTPIQMPPSSNPAPQAQASSLWIAGGMLGLGAVFGIVGSWRFRAARRQRLVRELAL